MNTNEERTSGHIDSTKVFVERADIQLIVDDFDWSHPATEEYTAMMLRLVDILGGD